MRYQRVAPRPLSIALYSAFAGGVASLVLPATLAWANPQGQQVVRGSATFQNNGNTLTVTNTPGAAINWQSFSIQKNETTHFQQANSASSVLNRVVANNPSELLGNLTSNGKVVLINPFGITVGRGAAVDTAGFTASTLNITDADWANGKLRFQGNSLSGDVKVDGVIRSPNGDVMLFAPNVSVGSEALIKADNGNVIIGAGQKVEVTGRGLEGIRFEIQSADNKAVNLGRIEGNAVGVFAGTLRHSGSITAQTATMEGGKVVLRAIREIEISGQAVVKADGAAGKAGGQITISSASGDVVVGNGARITANGGAGAAGGAVGVAAEQGKLVVEQSSVISADGSPAGSVRLLGATQAQVAGVVTAASPVRTDSPTHIEPVSLAISQAVGGKVAVLGDEVRLQAGAQVDVSGDGGGGIILIGGDFQGANADVRNAKNTDIAPGVVLTADGRAQGDGGKVIVWADNDTNFSGTISAKGGLLGGDGGFAETSGKHNLYYRGRTNLTAPRGRTGTLLLDPDAIVIMGGSQDGTDSGDSLAGTLNNGTGLGTVTSGPSSFTIYESEIEGTQANVYLMATNSISVLGTFTGGASGELTVQPGYNLRMQVTNATTGTHGIDLTGSDSGVGLVVRASYSTLTSQRGTISLETTSASSNGSVKVGSLVTDGGAVSIQAQGAVVIGQSGVGGIDTSSTTTLTGGGSVTILSKGSINVLSDIKTGTLSAIGGVIDLTAQTGLSNGLVNIYGTLFTNGANVNATGWSVNTLSGSTTGQINAGLGGVSLVGSGNSIGSFSGGVSIDFGTSVKGSSVAISADRFYMHSSAIGLTGTSNVAIAPFSVARGINIGGSDDLGTTFLGITQAENARITTPLLRIGSISNTGNIDVTSSFLRPGDAMSLITQGDVGQATLNPITASTLMAYGGSVQLLSKNLVGTFAGKATAAGLYYRSDGSFTVGAADFLTMTSAGSTGQLVLQADAGGSTITLASDVKSAGANIVFAADRIQVGNASVNTVTIDSNSSTVGAGGNIQFLGDITAAQSGRKLFVDASMGGAGNAGGNVSLNSVTNIGGAYLNLLDVNGYGDTAVGTVSFPSGSATLSLGANGSGVANQASLWIRNAGMSVGNHVTLNTNAGGGTLTAGGLIDVSSSVVSGDANNRSLKLLADGGTNGDGGTIRLGIMGNLSGGHVGELHASALGNGTGAMGQIQLFGNISTTSSSSTVAPASGDVRLYGDVVLYNDVTIRTSYQTEASAAGAVFLGTSGGEISSAAPGRTLTLDTSGATIGINGGNIFLWDVGNAAGEYLNSLNINAAGDAIGVVYLSGNNVSLAARGTLTSDQATLSIQNAHVRVDGSATLNTNAAGATLTAGGLLDLETARVGGTNNHATLVLKAHGGAHGDGGTIRIGEVAAFSDWLGGLTASAMGNGSGQIGFVELHGDIATTQSTLSTGNVMLDGNVVVHGNINIYTSTDTTTTGAGSVQIGTLGGSVSAAAKGSSLNINTSPANQDFTFTSAGGITLPVFDDAGDSYLQSLYLTAMSSYGFGENGTVKLNGNVLLDRGSSTLSSSDATLSITAGALELNMPSGSLTIDTLQQTVGSGGGVLLDVGEIYATGSDTVFRIDTSTPDNFAGRYGGDINIRGVIRSQGGTGASAPASVYLDSTAVSPATNGEIRLRRDILVGDGGTISLNGKVVIDLDFDEILLGSNSGSGSIDVLFAGSGDADFYGEGGLIIEAGSNGVVDLSQATIGANAPVRSLHIQGKQVTLGPVSSAGAISVTASGGALGVQGSILSVAEDGYGEGGGNITLTSTQAVTIANTVEIVSKGGSGADASEYDDAYAGGSGGIVSISGASIAVGNGVKIVSEGGRGGAGSADYVDGAKGGNGGNITLLTSGTLGLGTGLIIQSIGGEGGSGGLTSAGGGYGGGGGNGGVVSLSAGAGTLTVSASSTIGNYGGAGGYGGQGAGGDPGAGFGAPGGDGYAGGDGGHGGNAGAVRISAPALSVYGRIVSEGGSGGWGGDGGTGGQGGPGDDFGEGAIVSGDGGWGGNGGWGGGGGTGGTVTLAAGTAGALVVSGATVASWGGTGGSYGLGGDGGSPGVPVGMSGTGSSGSGGSDGDDGSWGDNSTVDLHSLSGQGMSITGSQVSGKTVTLESSGGTANLSLDSSDILAQDGAFLLANGGSILMGSLSSVNVGSSYQYNAITMKSDTGVQLAALNAPEITVVAPTIYSAPGFSGVHLTGELAILGENTATGYSDVGTMINPIKVDLLDGLKVNGNRNVWIESDYDLYLSGVQTHATSGTGTVHIHSGSFLSLFTGITGNMGAGNVGVFLSGDGGLEIGAPVRATGTGTIELRAGGATSIDVYDSVSSASGAITALASNFYVGSGGAVSSTDGQINVTATGIAVDGELDTGKTGIAMVLMSDSFDVQGTIVAASGTVAIMPQTAGNAIDVALSNDGPFAGALHVKVEQLNNNISAGVLQLGNADMSGGDVTFHAAVNPTLARTLAVYGENIAQDAGATLSLDGLMAKAWANVELTRSGNDIATVAGRSGAGSDFRVTTSSNMTVTTVAGVSGIDAGAGAGNSSVGLASEGGTITLSGAVSGKGGALPAGVFIIANDLDIDATGSLNTRGTSFSINPYNASRPLDLGGAPDAGEFTLDAVELSRIGSYNAFYAGSALGGNAFGDIQIGAPVNFGSAGLVLTATGTVSQGANAVTAGGLYVEAAGVSLGSAANSLSTGHLGGKASGGDFSFKNNGQLRITATGVVADGSVSLQSVSGDIVNDTASGQSIWAKSGNVSLLSATGLGTSPDRLLVRASGALSAAVGTGAAWLESDSDLSIGAISSSAGANSIDVLTTGTGKNLSVTGSSTGNDNWNLEASGNIAFGSSGSISAGSANLKGAGTITGPGSPTSAALNIAGHLDLTGTTIGSAGVPLWFNANTAEPTISAGSGGIYMLSVNALSSSSFDPTTPVGLNVVDVSSNGILTIDTDIGTEDTLNLRSTVGIHFNQSGGGTVSNGGGQLSLFGPVQSHSSFLFQGPVQHAGSWSLISGTTEFQGASTNLGSMTTGTGTTLEVGFNSTSVSTLSNGPGGTVVLTGGNLSAGTVASQSGVIDLGGGAQTLTVASGNLGNAGTLTGSGTVNLTGAGGTLVNNSLMTPGGDGAIGTIAILGNFSQGAAGRLKLDWSSATVNDHVSVQGDFASGGTLSVGESAGIFLVGNEQFSAIYTQGTITGGVPAFESRSTGVTFAGVFTAGEAGHLMVGPAGITNFWTKDTNAAESWVNAANWTRGHAPTQYEDAVVNVTNNPLITLTGGGNAAKSIDLRESLRIIAAASLDVGSGGLNVNTGGSVAMAGGTLAGAGDFDFNSGSTLTWTGGTLAGSGTANLLAGSVANVQTGTGQTLLRALGNAGTFNADDGLVLTAATLTNTGTLNLKGNGAANFSGTGTLVNAGGGTITTTTGTGYAQIGTAFSNDGLTGAGAANLFITGGGDSAGTLAIAAGRVLTLQGLAFDSTGSIVNSGGTLVMNPNNLVTITVSGGGYSELVASTVSIAGGAGGAYSQFDTALNTATLLQSNGLLTGSADITAGTFTRTAGSIGSTVGTPLFTTTGLATSSGSNFFANRDWRVQGGLNITGGYLDLAAGATLTNEVGSVLDLQASYFNGAIATIGGNGKLVNDGTLRNSYRSANASHYISIGVATLNNNGTIEFGADAVDPVRNLVIGSAGTHGSGSTLNIAAGKQVSLDSSGTRNFAPGSKIINSGTLRTVAGVNHIEGIFANTGTVNIASGNIYFNTGSEVLFPALTLAGNIGGNDALTLTGNSTVEGNILAGSGIFKIASGVTAVSTGGFGLTARTLRNEGTLNLSGGGSSFASTAKVENAGLVQQSGTARLDDFFDGTAATVTNQSGGVYLYTSSSTDGFEPMMVNQSGALLQVQSGVLSLSGGLSQSGNIVVDAGTTLTTPTGYTNNGDISGFGTLSVGAGTLTNAGALRPGGTGAIGTLRINGSLNMGAGTLYSELAGPASYDVLNVTGNLVKSGTVDVSELGAFVAGGQTFDVVTFGGTLTGTTPALVSSVTDVSFGLTAPGQMLRLSADSVTNRWAIDAGGVWSVAANWSRGHAPNQFENVIIDRALAAPVVTLNSAGALAKSLVVVGDDTLRITGASASLSLGSGGGILSNLVMAGGTLAGGAVIHSGTAGFSGNAQVQSGFTSTGTLNVSGTGVVFSGGGLLNAGTLNLAGGSGISFNAGSFNLLNATITAFGDTFNITNNGHVTLSGSTALTGVFLNIDGTAGTGGHLTLNNTGINDVGDFYMHGANALLDGTAALAVNGDFTWSGGTMAAGGTVTVNAGTDYSINTSTPVLLNRTLVNQSLLSVEGSNGLVLGATGTVINDSGATLYLSPDGSSVISTASTGRVINDGTIAFYGGFAPASTSAIDAKLDNNGTLQVTDGTLVLAGTLTANAGVIDLQASSTSLSTSSRDFVNSTTGSIIGFGTLDLGGGTLTNNGNVNPGDASSAGVLKITGSYVQGSSGTLGIDAASSSLSDKLQISGTAALDGTLNVGETGSYTIGFGDGYLAVTAASVGGTFTVVNGPMGVTLTPSYGATSVSLFTAGGPVNNWIGTNGDWSNTANWSLGRIPATGDIVVIDPSGINTITLASAAASGLLSLDFSAGGNDDIFLFSTGGTLSLPSNATLNGTLHIAGGTLTSASGPQTANMLKLSSGRLENSAAFNVTSAALGSGTVIGSGTLNVSGALDWTTGIFNGGTLSTSGATTLANGTHVLANALWVNTGTVTHSGGSFSLTDSVLSNQQVFTNTEAGGDLFEATSGINLVHNSGTFNWSQAGTRGSGLTPFNNDGVVNVDTGATADMQSGGSGAGAWVAATGATLQFSGGTRYMDSGSDMAGAGTMKVNGGVVYVDGSFSIAGSGTVSMNGGELYLNTGGTLSFAHGVTLSGAATLDLANDAAFQGLTLNASEVTGMVAKTVIGLFTLNNGAIAGGTLTTNGGATLGGANQVLSDLVWLNADTISHTGGTLHLNNGSTLVNQAGGLINQTGNGVAQPVAVTVSSGANGFIDNAGTINWSVTGSRGIFGDVGLNNTGTINVTGGTFNMAGAAGFGQSGTLLLGTGTSFQRDVGFNNTGYIAGTGTIAASSGTVTNMGTLSPGGEGAAGTLHINGSFNMSSGTLLAELASTGVYDKVVVSGNLSTGGTVEVSELNTFVGGGDAFNVVSHGGTLSAGMPTAVSTIADVSDFLISTGAGNFTLTADGVVNYWLDGITGNWASAANWSRAHAPNALEDVIINPTGTQTITVNSGSQAAHALSMLGDDILVISGGSLGLANASTVGSAASLVLSGGTLSGAGSLDVAGAFNWNGGKITAGAVNVAGVLTIGNAAVKELTGTLSHSNASGLSSWIGGDNGAGGVIDIIAGGRLINQAGAVLEIATGGQNNRVGAYGTLPVGFLDNYGTLDVTGGGSFAFSPSNYFNQQHQLRNFATGVVNVTDSHLYMHNDASSPVAQLGTWNFTGSGGTAVLSLYGNNVWDAGATINTSGDTVLYVSGATQLYTSAAQTWSTVHVIGGNSLAVNQDLSVTDRMYWTGTVSGSSGAAITLGAGANSAISAGAALSGANLLNEGTLTIGSGVTLNAGQLVSNAGLLTLGGGTLTASSGLANSGTVSGNGRLNTSGTFSSTGTITPGGAGTVGTITVSGNADLSGGTVDMDLASLSSYDLLAVSGNLVQGGTLNVAESSPFIGAGDVFDIVTYGGSVSGTAPAINAAIAGVVLGIDTTAAAGGALRLAPTSVTNFWLTGSGNWTDSAKWSRGHAPTSGESITVDPSSGAETVTITSGTSGLAALTLGGDDTFYITGGNFVLPVASTLAGTLTLAGGTLTNAGAVFSVSALNWESGFIGGTGGISGALTFSGTGSRGLTGSTITAFGGTSLSGGALQLDGGAFGWSSGTLTVAGGATLGINGGAIDAKPLLNQGTVSIGSSAAAMTLLDASGTQSGQFIIGTGKTLDLGSGNVTLASGAGITGGAWHIGAGQVSIAGTLDRGAGSATDLTGGTLAVAGSLVTASLAVSGGLLQGTGDVTVTRAFSQTAGSIGTAFDEISITQQSGDLSIGSLEAGSVTLAAMGGSLLDGNGATTNVTAASVKLAAATGIHLDLDTPLLDASLSGSGSIDVSNTGALELASVTASAGAATFSVGGPLTQSGAVYVTGQVSIATGGAGVTLDDPLNDFGDKVTLVGTGATSIADMSGLSVAGSAASLTLDAQDVSAGSLTVSGPLTITASGQISQGASISVTGLTNLSAASIVMPTASAYSGGVTFNTSNDVTLASSGSLVLAGTANHAGGSLSLTAAGPVSQTGVLTVSGAANVLAAGQTIDFGSMANDFSSVSFNAANVVLNDINSVAIGGMVSGAFQASAAALTQESGQSLFAGSAMLTGSTGISLTGANELGTLSAASSGAISINDVGTSLTLGNISTPASLAVQSGGAVLRGAGATLSSGSLDVFALSVGTSLQPMVFTAPVAGFYGVTGGVHAQSAQAFTLAGLAAGTNASVLSAQALSVTGEAFAQGVLSLAGQGVTVQGAIAAQGVSLNAGTGTLLVGGGMPGSVFGGSSVALSGQDILVSGGAAPASAAYVISDGGINVNAAGNFVIRGGSGAGALAEVTSFGPLSVTAGGAVDVLGGTGSGAYAKLDPAAQFLLSVTAQSVSLQGGSGQGAYAGIVSEGDITVQAPGGISMTAGTGSDSDAVVVSYFGKVTLPSCNGCVKLTVAPFGNGVADVGVLGGEDYLSIITDNFVTPNELVQIQQLLTQLSDKSGRRDDEDKGDPDIVIEGQVCQ